MEKRVCFPGASGVHPLYTVLREHEYGMAVHQIEGLVAQPLLAFSLQPSAFPSAVAAQTSAFRTPRQLWTPGLHTPIGAIILFRVEFMSNLVNWLELMLVLLLAAGNLAGARERGLPASEGIVNFGKVNDRLYRGAQPDATGMRNLKRLGVKTILNLRQTNDVWKGEAAEACADGLIYTNVPMKGFGRPSPEQVAKALAIIETLPSPVFVHCQHGCDRAGTIIACYRIQHDHWSSEAAWQEAKHYGISMFAWGMKKYIVEFGKAATKR